MSPSLGHAHVCKARVSNILGLDAWHEQQQIGRVRIRVRFRVPDFYNIVRIFGANRHAIHKVGRVHHDLLVHGRNGVIDKGLPCLLFGNAETVGASINVFCVFPERGDGIPHEEEHSIGQGVCVKRVYDIQDLAPCLHRAHVDKGAEPPLGLIGWMEI